MRRWILILLSGTLVFSGACKPNAEREMKKWEGNKKRLMELQTEYPRFASHLGTALADAQKAWKAAEAEGNAEKKAEAMSKANDLVDTKLVRQLGSIKSRSEGIDKDIKDLTSKKVPANKVKQINNLISSARTKQRESAGILSTGDVATMEAATQTADDAVAKLISASGDVSSAKTAAKKKK